MTIADDPKKLAELAETVSNLASRHELPDNIKDELKKLFQLLPPFAKSVVAGVLNELPVQQPAAAEESSSTNRKYIMFAWFNSEYASICDRNWFGPSELLRMNRLIPFTDVICEYLRGMYFSNTSAHELAPLLNTLLKRFLGTAMITEISDDERAELMVCWHNIVQNFVSRRKGVREEHSMDECFPIKNRGK
jgi:hypothetical protein